MSNISVYISQLDNLTASMVTEDDFFPYVDSSSFTTFRTSVQNINTVVTRSGFAFHTPSASYSLNSLYSFGALSSSFCISSSCSIIAQHVDFPDINFMSYSLSSSWASQSISSSFAVTTSFAQFSTINFISYSLSSSWASQSISSSYTQTASYIIRATKALTSSFISDILNKNQLIKAKGIFSGFTGTAITQDYSSVVISPNSVNVQNIEWLSTIYQDSNAYTVMQSNNRQFYSKIDYYKVTLSKPLPSTNYTALGSFQVYSNDSSKKTGSFYGTLVMSHDRPKTATAFTMSLIFPFYYRTHAGAYSLFDARYYEKFVFPSSASAQMNYNNTATTYYYGSGYPFTGSFIIL
jgi:hypothetical protein